MSQIDMRIVHGILLCAFVADSAFAQESAQVEEILTEPLSPPGGGWFGNVDLMVVRPRVYQYPTDLYSGVRLATTVVPEFSGGYRFAGGRSLHLDYRLLISSGNQSYFPQTHPIGLGPADEILSATGPYRGQAKFRMQSFDLDLTFREPFWELLPFVRSRWEIGARALDLTSEITEPKVFDNRFGWNPDQASEWFGDETLRSTYRGYGPHFDYKLAIAVESWGLEVFASSDVAVLFGTRTARYSPVEPQPYRNGRMVGPGWDMLAGRQVLTDARPISEHRFACTAWNWRGDLGVKLTRPWRGRTVSVAAGYRMDFWTFGSKSNGGGGMFGGTIKVPELGLEMKGAFLRLEIQY